MNSISHPTGLTMMQALLERPKPDKPPFPHLANALAILAHDPMLAGSLGYNEFEEEPQMLRPSPAMNPGDAPACGPYPRNLRSADAVAITAYVQRAHNLPRLMRGTVEDAIRTEAERNRFHPVRDWLASLRWDGKPRLGTWLVHAFGAPATPYTAAVGAKTLIAAVRRVREPGCKFDTMPVFEGHQGAGKSRCMRRLFGADWFTDSMPPDLKSKDGSIAVLGIWAVEFAEIEHLIRTDTDSLKAFLSRPVERFRPPYERATRKRGRECVFVGTTNREDYLRDETGGRRFWPIRCAHADEDWIAANRVQLWAEAAAREASGEILWLEEDARDGAAAAQTERIMDDAWADKVRAFLEEERGRFAPHVTVPAVMHGIGLTTAQMDKRAEMRVALVLAREGMARATLRVDGRPRKVWMWPDTPP